jgi:hypothetical protein
MGCSPDFVDLGPYLCPSMATATTLSRPASDFEPLELLGIVREVAEASGMTHPERIATRAWDRAQEASEAHADAPPARRIAETLGLSWSKVVELAFVAPARQRIALGQALNERQGNWLTTEYAEFVLRLLARRLNVETLRPGQYRVACAEMLAADRARWMHGGNLRLPTEDQIAAVAGGWDQALANAGLAARDPRGDQPASPRVVELIERCYSHHGAQPSHAELVRFCRANGLAMARLAEGRTWTSYVEEWKAERRRRGLPMPDGLPPASRRPNYDADVGAAQDGDQSRKRRWDDEEELVAHAMRFLQQLSRGRRATQRAYADWSARHPGTPWPSAFEQYGGWVAVYQDARRRLRRGEDPSALLAAARERQLVAEAERRPAEEHRRASPRRRGRKSAVSLAQLIEAGLLAPDEELSAGGGRWRATFDPQTGRVDVVGVGTFESLTSAALHCSGHPTANRLGVLDGQAGR